MKRELQDDTIYERQAQLCKMLSHPTRLKILNELKQSEKTVNELVEILGISQPTVSQHLSELKQRGLVGSERDGVSVKYRLKHPEIMEACKTIRNVLFEQFSEDKKLLKDKEVK